MYLPVLSAMFTKRLFIHRLNLQQRKSPSFARPRSTSKPTSPTIGAKVPPG
ncbi:hypothetical protein KCP73_16715 [Salmonella enterica subsp. enterica]|nr:hypothetical protein KCP73_16715 [Salmonella enterica subsp. enterica]